MITKNTDTTIFVLFKGRKEVKTFRDVEEAYIALAEYRADCSGKWRIRKRKIAAVIAEREDYDLPF